MEGAMRFWAPPTTGRNCIQNLNTGWEGDLAWQESGGDLEVGCLVCKMADVD